MTERKRSDREDRSSLGGLDSLFTQDDAPSMVTVSHGHYCEQLPVGGRTVGEIRSSYADRFDIDPESHAYIDANQVDETTVVSQGQMLMFMRKSGEKGSSERSS